MKRILLHFPFLMFFALSLGAKAQDTAYCPLVEDGKRWTYENDNPIRPAQYNYVHSYYFEGDTVIDGNHCLKMYTENEGNGGKILYKGAFFEKDKKVYCIREGSKPSLIYDFDCKEGDEVTVEEGPLTVVRIFSEQNEGRTLRFYEMSPSKQQYPDADNFHFYWIEGVGCTQDFFGMTPWPGNYNSLSRCEVRGQELYQYNYTAIHDLSAPEMVNGQTSNGKWYDLSGRRIGDGQWKMDNGQLPRGVYIRDGRKVMVK